MKKIFVPIVLVLTLSGGAFLAGFAITDAMWDSAYAQGVESVDAGPEASAVPDPVADPGGAASAVWELWKASKIPAVILLLFLAATWVHRRKWLKGRTAFYLASGLSAFALIGERAAAGDTPSVNMLVTAGMTLALAIIKFEFSDKEQA